MKEKSKFWIVDHWVQFTINIKSYSNIIVFLENQDILFLSTANIDFSLIPIQLHGYGHSNNLSEYLSNNNNILLIQNFLNYFLTQFFDFRYVDDNSKMSFHFTLSGDTWQELKVLPIPPIVKNESITVDSELITCDDQDITCDQI